MARKPRIEYEGAFYHVLTRGNQKQKIFKDKEDFIKYLEILSDYKNQYHYYLFAYILMDNHVHLLMETTKTPLSKILQGINQKYTAYFNKRYNTVGHLFQGRYKAFLCDRDAYLLSLVKYIHLNPLRARIVNMPEGYKWSSHHSYIGAADYKDIVDTDKVLRMFSEDKTKARSLYWTYIINDGIAIKRGEMYRTIDQRILGSERFAERVMEKYDIEIDTIKRKKKYTLHEIAQGVEKAYGISLKQIREKSKKRWISSGKKLLSIIAHEYGYPGREIALFIRKDPAMVTRYLKQKEKLTKQINEVERVMSRAL